MFPKLKTKAILAPMAGITDVAFRDLCFKYGCSFSFTEFVPSAGIVRGGLEKKPILTKGQGFVGVQVFGNRIQDIIASAKKLQNRFDIIDINCGCPAHKVVKIGAGSALMKQPKKIQKIVSKLVKKVSKPVTVKIRSGFDKKNAVEVSKLIEKAGASAVTVHARLAKQGYSGKSDWKLIKKVKENVNIPVIGNGDVKTPEDFISKLENYNVDYVMIGRGAIGNPYLFKQINDYVKKGSYCSLDKLEQFREYLKLAKKYSLDYPQIKNQAIYFTKGAKNSRALRRKIMKTKNLEEIKKELRKI